MCQGVPKGVAVCIVDPEERQVLLGLERFGKYRGKYNLCAGSLEPEDDGCAVNAARREMCEEFKLAMSDVEFHQHFGMGFGQNPRSIMIGATPILVGHFRKAHLPSVDLTRRMKCDMENDGLPGTWKEMETAKWFSWNDDTTLAWSRFARAVMKKVAGHNRRPAWSQSYHKNPKISK